MAVKKDSRLHPIPMTSAFKSDVYKLAQKKGMSMNALVRYLLRREIEKESKINEN